MTDTDPTSVVARFIAAVTGARLDEAAGLLAPDVQWINGASSAPSGADAVIDELRPVLDACDEAEWVTVASATEGDNVFVERRDRFRKGDLWVEVPVIGIFEVRHGRIIRWRDYFDEADGGRRLAPLFA